MKRTLTPVFIIVLSSLLFFSLFTVAGAQRIRSLRGFWEATDSDGSHMHLIVGGSGSHIYMVWLDDYWSICGGDGGLGFGHGTVDTADFNRAHVAVTFYCAGRVWGTVSSDFTYDPGTDTMVDTADAGVSWTRVGRR